MKKMPVAMDICPPQKTWEEYKCELEALKKSNNCNSEKEEIAFARSFSFSVMKFLWRNVNYKKRWECRQIKIVSKRLDIFAIRLAKDIADYFITLNIMEYAYLLGSMYTMLLPDSYRSDNGVYYTPPSISERLLDLLAAEGADWAEAKILDPACGGGAFLVTVANRMLGDYRIKELSAIEKIEHIEKHLSGIEIDGFAAWITQMLVDILLYSETIAAGRRLKSIVKVQDTIQCIDAETRRFDVIVGNPPFGKIKLDEETRRLYSRSLYGHANLYGLFIDASLRILQPGGLVGFVTPTSFLGGKYFSNLRKLLVEENPPLAIDFIAMRSGVFDQVLQETCLVVFGPNRTRCVTANKINVENNVYSVERIGSFQIEEGIKPWVIAREPAEANIVKKVRGTNTTLQDYGYKVSTGQLVWNRLKTQIYEKPECGVRPIIWAEAISANGQFKFSYQYRRKMRYIKISERQEYLICKQAAVLVQRTTAKEQSRRLQTCILPQDFIDKWDGVVVENHVNIVHSISDAPKVSRKALSLILNSQTVDRIFRCLSGSVAVSATELQAIPLPPVANLKELEEIAGVVHKANTDQKMQEKIENIILRAYGLED